MSPARPTYVGPRRPDKRAAQMCPTSQTPSYAARMSGPRTHACPLCGRPAPHLDRYPRAVCDDCRDRATDSAGRPVAGHNTSMSGGFEARFVADGGVCDEVTRTGRCLVDGHPCAIGEARFGGVVVEALQPAGNGRARRTGT